MLPFLMAMARAGATIGSAEVGAARASLTAKGQVWRQAMSASGGNRAIAKEAVTQKAADIREQQESQRRLAMEQDKESARQQQKFTSAMTPSFAKEVMSGPTGAATASIGAGTHVINDQYRTVAMSLLPGPAAAMVGALGRLTDAIEARGRELSMFSPHLAVATGTADLRQLRANMYEAHIAGQSYGRVIDEGSKLQTSLQEAFAPIKDLIAESAADILQSLNALLVEGKPLIQKMYEVMVELKVINQQMGAAVIHMAQGDFADARKDIADINKNIAKKLEDMRIKEMSFENQFAAFWNDPLLQLPVPQRGPLAPALDPAGGALGIPLVGP